MDMAWKILRAPSVLYLLRALGAQRSVNKPSATAKVVDDKARKAASYWMCPAFGLFAELLDGDVATFIPRVVPFKGLLH